MAANRERRPSREKKGLRAWMIALVAMVPAALSADETMTSLKAGGSGGNHYSTGCGFNAMVGVQGRTYDTGLPGVGEVVGSIQAICVALQGDGSWNGTPAPAPGIAGRERGTSVSLRCPQNQAVSGISGKAGIYLNQLRINCAPLVEPGHLSSEGSPLAGSIGGTGGNGFGPVGYLCTSNKPGYEFSGGADQWVDSVALFCKYPAVAAPVVKSLSLSVGGLEKPLSGTSVVGGTTVNGTVRLNAKAGGAVVNLSMSVPSGVATFQSNPITVSYSTIEAPFVINTNPVSSNITTSISATPNTGTLLAPLLTIHQPSFQTLNLSTTRTSPGGSVTGTVSLNGKAFSGGVAVNLASSDAATATVPSAVSIPQNQTSATFPVTVGSANQSGCSVISAAYNQVRQEVLLTVPITGNPAFALAIPPTFSGSVTATVSYPGASNAARTLSLVSSKPRTASVPLNVIVPAGATSASFAISIGGSSPGLNCAVITATDSAANRNSVILKIAGSLATTTN